MQRSGLSGPHRSSQPKLRNATQKVVRFPGRLSPENASQRHLHRVTSNRARPVQACGLNGGCRAGGCCVSTHGPGHLSRRKDFQDVFIQSQFSTLHRCKCFATKIPPVVANKFKALGSFEGCDLRTKRTRSNGLRGVARFFPAVAARAKDDQSTGRVVQSLTGAILAKITAYS